MTVTPVITPDHTLNDISSRQIRRSDRYKKPSGRWTVEAGFVPHPLWSNKKKIPEDPREGIHNLSESIFSSWTDAQFFNYSNSCGVQFLGSPSHKLKCLDKICSLEKDRVAKFKLSSDSPRSSDS